MRFHRKSSFNNSSKNIHIRTTRDQDRRQPTMVRTYFYSGTCPVSFPQPLAMSLPESQHVGWREPSQCQIFCNEFFRSLPELAMGEVGCLNAIVWQRG